MTIRRRSFDGRRPIGREVRRGNEPAQGQAEGLVPLVRGTQRGQQPQDMVPGRGKGWGMAGNPDNRPYRLGLGMALVPRNVGIFRHLPL